MESKLSMSLEDLIKSRKEEQKAAKSLNKPKAVPVVAAGPKPLQKKKQIKQNAAVATDQVPVQQQQQRQPIKKPDNNAQAQKRKQDQQQQSKQNRQNALNAKRGVTLLKPENVQITIVNELANKKLKQPNKPAVQQVVQQVVRPMGAVPFVHHPVAAMDLEQYAPQQYATAPVVVRPSIQPQRKQQNIRKL